MTLTTHAPVARPAPRKRTGFTLVELLVVLAIIAVMLAILGAALQKTLEGRKVSTTKEQMYKLQQSLDLEYDRVVKKCADDSRTPGGIPAAVVTYADNDPNRALAIWTALHLRRQFPETFAEATTDYTLNGYTLTHLTTFNEVQGLPSSPIASDESGALLYIILAKKSVTGGGAMTSSADDLTQSLQRKVTFGTQQLPTFADAWKGSVGFRRWYGAQTGDLAEVQSPPYLDSKTGQTPNNNKDPLDPRDLVAGWNLSAGDARIATMNTLLFKRLNRMATVYSLGKDTTDPTDDLFGFRLRKFGN